MSHLSLITKLVVVILLGVGSVLMVGGTQLVLLGGSPYYVASGVALLISSWWTWQGRPAGYWLYCCFAAVTLIWAIAESGFDLWALLPRLTVPMALLLGFLLTPVRRDLQIKPVGFWVSPIILSTYLLSLITGVANAQFTPQPGLGLTLSSEGKPPQWTHYGASADGDSYSAADQINRTNVDQLEPAWTFHTEEDAATQITFQSTPIEIEGDLFFCSPSNRVFSIDGDTGAENWSFDPQVNREKIPFFVCRGVSHHRSQRADSVCASRLLMGTVDDRLLALDSKTGTPCPDFGVDGEVDLTTGLGTVMPGHHYVSSPPAIIGDIAVVGSFIMDNQSTQQPPGVVRAYNVHTGELVWAWDVLHETAHARLKEGESYPLNTANVWSVISADEALGLVYLPTGNVPPDFFGGFRSAEQDRYPGSIVALDAATGDVRWSFQTVHHDIWDYDIGAQPVLLDFPLEEGTSAPALITATKWGDVFVLDRRTGEPLTEVIEKPVPQNPVEGEFLSPTQPFSVGFPSFAPADLSEEKMWGSSMFDQLWCRIAFKKRRYEGLFTPQSLQGTIQNPGNFGAVDWGSVSIDSERNLMLVNSTGMPFLQVLYTREQADELGFSLWGSDLDDAADDEDSGGMVSAAADVEGAAYPLKGTPYGITSNPFLSPFGFPCHQPPWGELTAVDLTSRSVLWKRSIGTTDGHAPFGLAFPTGVFNLGGTAVTRGGLTFVSGTIDNFLRAFDTETGAELWRGRLPAGGQAGPMTYVSPKTGKQYVVIPAGGHVSMQTDLGDAVVAFALPEN
ncbi:membrane-bound PQQ-dependent dehydrogenase, glucose/quinate/shikimate family [Luminiphilus sp.]|nr:membrane-bound PQQ-dependent dehydrogenase, glucose/quinate/shikimate family [Luminiphilus sp.]